MEISNFTSVICLETVKLAESLTYSSVLTITESNSVITLFLTIYKHKKVFSRLRVHKFYQKTFGTRLTLPEMDQPITAPIKVLMSILLYRYWITWFQSVSVLCRDRDLIIKQSLLSLKCPGAVLGAVYLINAFDFCPIGLYFSLISILA